MVLCQLHICILERQSGKVSTCLVDIFITNLTDLSSSITWCSYNIYIASLTSVEHGCKQWSTEQLLHQPLQLHSRPTAYNYFHQLLLLLFWWTLWCVACTAWPRSSSEDAYTVNKIFPSHWAVCQHYTNPYIHSHQSSLACGSPTRLYFRPFPFIYYTWGSTKKNAIFFFVL